MGWYIDSKSSVPSGYVTTYSVNGGRTEATRENSSQDGGRNATFSFATFRMAGHEVPHYVPEAAYVAISRWLAHQDLTDLHSEPIRSGAVQGIESSKTIVAYV